MLPRRSCKALTPGGGSGYNPYGPGSYNPYNPYGPGSYNPYSGQTGGFAGSGAPLQLQQRVSALCKALSMRGDGVQEAIWRIRRPKEAPRSTRVHARQVHSALCIFRLQLLWLVSTCLPHSYQCVVLCF